MAQVLTALHAQVVEHTVLQCAIILTASNLKV
jgi:hypothetical protein